MVNQVAIEQLRDELKEHTQECEVYYKPSCVV